MVAGLTSCPLWGITSFDMKSSVSFLLTVEQDADLRKFCAERGVTLASLVQGAVDAFISLFIELGLKARTRDPEVDLWVEKFSRCFAWAQEEEKGLGKAGKVQISTRLREDQLVRVAEFASMITRAGSGKTPLSRAAVLRGILALWGSGELDPWLPNHLRRTPAKLEEAVEALVPAFGRQVEGDEKS